MISEKEVKELNESLHPLERAVLPVLKEGISTKEIEQATGLQEIEVNRAVQWLENKKLIKIKREETEVISLARNGMVYKEKGLPERRCIKVLERPLTLQEIRERANLDADELSIALGVLKKMGAISVGEKVVVTEKGKSLQERELPGEQMMKCLPMNKVHFSAEQRQVYEELKRRKQILDSERKTLVTVNLTDLGRKLAKEKRSDELIERVTPAMMKSMDWEKKKFRRFDVKAKVPEIMIGKRHPYASFLDEVKQKLAVLGFQEMTGPIVETEFYNFDALFQPQGHPARTWTDTYRLKFPKKGYLPRKEVVKAVKEAHEHGGKTGSKGWKYTWNPEIAMQLMPRAHDTAISPRYLSQGVKIPGKYFSIVRCYRPDVIDATHGVEFNQLGGFVIDENLNFRHLLGLLKQFAEEMTGASQVKFLPDYYPFTEPSVQISVKHPEFGWMELAGAGIFRPEMTEALGIKEPVIAWGFGIDRLAMLKLGIKDIRYLFSQNIAYLRSAKMVMM